MADESPLTVLFNAAPVESVQQAEVEKPNLAQVPAEPTPEETQAIEAVFAQQQENRLVAGLLGMWTGALVMRDIAVETFGKSEDEEEPDPRKKKKDEEQPDDEP